MRADKFLFHHCGLGRKEARRKIDSGLLRVNQLKIEAYDSEIGKFDVVELDREVIQSRSAVYIMLHKPSGYVCATVDKENRTVMELLGDQAEKLHIVGRLDKNTTGMVLLTNDGAWSRSISNPSSKYPKVYLVESEYVISESMIRAFKEGIHFEKEGVVTTPAQVVILGERKMELTIYEGMHHQIKRMFLKFQNRVVSLHRCSVAGVELDIPEGEWRYLSEYELEAVSLD